METVLEDPYILMTTEPISHPQDLMPTLDVVMKSPRPLVILAEKVDGGGARDARRRTTSTARSRPSRSRAPGFGHRRIHHLGDLAAFTGGR